MRLRVEADAPEAGRIVARVVVDNDTDAPIVFDRRELSGPNLSGPRGLFPESAEPAFEEQSQNDVVLGGRCFYGRERTWEYLAEGEYELTAELRTDPHVGAEPVRLTLPG